MISVNLRTWEILQPCLNTLSFLFGAFMVSQLLRDRKAPGSTWAWLLIMILIPYLGVPLYLVFGGRKIKRKVSKKRELYRAVPYTKTPSNLLPVERILLSSGGPAKTFDNRTTFLSSGDAAYHEVVKLIVEAKKEIWITTFILGSDPIATEVVRRLTEQAKKGIDVRLLLDGVGSLWTTRLKLRKLKKAGGKVSFFLPLFHLPFFGHSNLRNHRKIMIADQSVAIVGGMNIAQEYMGPEPKAPRWVDLAYKIEGSSVTDLISIFTSDWNFSSHDKIEDVSMVSSASSPLEQSAIQVVASGPDVSRDTLYDSILSAIFNAEKRIWMATPYFIPDDTLIKALELACARGVDVRLITPKRSDHPLVDFCRSGYLKQLDRAGGRLHFYSHPQHPMMHAKATLIDNRYAVVGSANIDMRSLLLNYELGIFLYSKSDQDALEAWFLSLQENAPLTHLKRTRLTDSLDGVGRILGPML